MDKMIRGETKPFKIYLPSTVTISSLGTPHVAIAQSNNLIEPTVPQDGGTGSDAGGEYVAFTLTEAQSLALVSGRNAYLQITWVNTVNNVDTIVKGAIHSFWVSDSLTEEV